MNPGLAGFLGVVIGVVGGYLLNDVVDDDPNGGCGGPVTTLGADSAMVVGADSAMVIGADSVIVIGADSAIVVGADSVMVVGADSAMVVAADCVGQ